MRYHLKLRLAVMKKLKITGFGTDVEKWEPLCTVGEIINWYRHMVNSMDVPQEIKNMI